MNRSFIVAVLTVTMIIMMSTAGLALTGVHNLACDNCHGKFLGSGAVAATNSCISCHSTNAEAARMPVDADAMANYFGTVAGQPATGSRSTHTYMAATVSVPNKANTVEPTAAGLVNPSPHNSTVLTNQLLCIRCHAAGANSNNTPKVNKPFLRSTNVDDALCLDCHRNRVAQDTTVNNIGSHPVAYRSYSAVYKTNTTAFRKTPLSPNPYNQTAMLGAYLNSKGKIVCSTCHSIHYADSNSATLDNRSTANGFAQDDPAKGLKGQLQNSKGQLLRTDPIGSSATAINVCSSCHKETRNLNHNARGQNIQCDHCHGAHVDYTGDATLPNLYLVRRDFSNMSTDKVKLGAGVKVIYNSATSLSFNRADGKGICQVCHTPPAGGIHEQANTRKEDCIVCHNHANGFTAAECTSCHGQPPITGSVGGPNGKASQNYQIDESLTAHATHVNSGYYNYACKNCHYDGTRADSHDTYARTGTATFASVFVETAGSVGDQPAKGLSKNVPGDYNTSARTCSAVYCHSNGNPRDAANVYAIDYKTTPSWEYGKGKIVATDSECTSCHGAGTDLVVTNAHDRHVKVNSIKCYVCHAGTVNDNNGITDRNKHANGAKDVSFIAQAPNNQSVFTADPYNSADATCVTSCHTNGFGVSPATPAKWTDSSTGACGTCHAASPVTNAHGFHFYSSTGPMLGSSSAICSNCHVYSSGATTHANGVVDKQPCTPCHPGTSAVWTNAATITCESCHTGATASNVNGHIAPLKNDNATLGHGQYALASACSACHNANAPHIAAGAAEKRLLVAGNAQCNTCHISAVMQGMSTARANMLTHGVSYSGSVNTFVKYTTSNDFRARDCAGCHDTHGTTNRLSIRTVINGQSISFKSLTSFCVSTKTNNFYNGLCQVCHTKTKYYRNYTTPETHNPNSNCMGCHTHKGGMFAFQQTIGGGCNGCHGYPPVSNMAGLGTMGNYTTAQPEDYVGGGGAHSVAGHIPRTAKEGSSWSNCSNCHFNTTHNTGGTPAKKAFVNVIVDPQFKFNNTTSITYNANSCSNVSCHFKPSPNWTTGL